MDILGNVNLGGIGELQNANIQNLATAPTTNLSAGRLYFNTVDHTLYVYNGTAWVDALSQGDYTFQNGVELVANTRNVQIALASGANVGNVTLSTTNGLAANVAEASTSAKGIIEIATDTEASTGTSEVLAVNPKQLATKVTGNAAITGATKCKITYDSKGLVTGGADLQASDIPNLTLSKITDVTATAAEVNILDGATLSTAELNILDGVTVTASDINSVTSKIALTDLSIDSGSTNYLGYNSSTGKFSANVDTTVGTVSTNLVTSGAVNTALSNKLDKKPDGTNNLIDTGDKINTVYIPDVLLGQMLYAGTFVPSTAAATLTTNAKTKLGTTSDTITLTNDTTAVTGYKANEGCFYICSADGTFASISFLVGDWLISTGTGWTKIDNTDAVTGVKGNAESTYRIGNVNITIDNVAPTQSGNSGKFLTTDGTNCSWATVDALPSQTGNSGKFLTTNGTSASWANIVGKYSAQNGALTVSGGHCLWTVTHNLGSDVQVSVYRVSDGAQVLPNNVTLTSSTVATIDLLATADIAADTYKVVVIGL